MSTVADEKLLLSPREAARMLSVSERTLWTLTRDKRIESRKIGRLVRYPLDDLKRFATECR
ncbi:MAG: helix-turn-helix domain-containing protein [Pirellulales bacterium]|nr:helix-turn-helix domain-containing protein [Pirellulales bacterium]